MNVKERIKKFIKYEDISITDFEKSINVANGYVNSISKSIGIDKINAILENYSNLSIEWLITGKGSMLKEAIPRDDQDIAIPATLQKGPDIKPIPFVEQRVVAGFGNADFSIADRDVKDYYVVPKFKHHKIDFMIEIYGSSMYPKYNSGDVVACRIIRESKFIQWNKVHVIATSEQGLLVKRIKKGPSITSITVISDNPNYDPFDIPIEEITGIAIVVGVIRIE